MSPPDSVPFSMPPSHHGSASVSQMSLFPTIPSHHAQYSSYTVPSPPRQYSAHATSSAFSASANADEDWTKISDLAERRRIQNRIAQRNYRKKLKRRLEDLERRAGSSDGASAAERPVFAGVGKKRQTKKSAAAQQQQQQQQRQQQQQHEHDQHQQDQLHQHQHHQHHHQQQHHHHHHSSPPQSKHVPQPGYTPPSHHDDEIIYPQTTYGERDRSDTPPLFPYSTYPPPSHDEMIIPTPAAATYSPAPPYQQQQQTMTAAENYPTYLASAAPVTLPSLTHFSEPHIKREPYSGNGEDAFTPYIGYGFIPGIDVNAPSPYDPSNPHTPPLTHFDNSASCSEAGYEYPATPLSIPPESPSMVPRQQ